MSLNIKTSQGLERINSVCVKSGYSEVNCTSAEYAGLSVYDPRTIYVVTYPNGIIKKYLGDKEIGGSTAGISALVTAGTSASSEGATPTE